MARLTPEMIGGIRRWARETMGAVALVCSFIPSVLEGAGTLYFVDLFKPDFRNGSIKRIRTDGSGLETMHVTGWGARALAVDLSAGLIYWSDVERRTISSKSTSSGMVKTLFTARDSDEFFAYRMAPHQDSEKIFWGDQTSNQIFEANLDGTAVRKVLDADYTDGFAIDHEDHVYWIGAHTTGYVNAFNPGKAHFSIRRATPGDWEVETIIENVGWLHDLAVDAVRDRLYFTTSEPGCIFVSTLDGRNGRFFVKTANENIIHELTIDPSSGDLYWSDELSPNRNRIKRRNLKTGEISIVGPVEGFGNIGSFVIVPDKSEIMALPRAERSREETPAVGEGEQSAPHPAIKLASKPDHMDLEMLMRLGEPPSLNFPATAGSRYRVQYSSDLKEWRNAGDPIIASGAFLTWTDSGPPVTESLPGVVPRRFYRIVELE